MFTLSFEHIMGMIIVLWSVVSCSVQLKRLLVIPWLLDYSIAIKIWGLTKWPYDLALHATLRYSVLPTVLAVYENFNYNIFVVHNHVVWFHGFVKNKPTEIMITRQKI